MKLWRAIKEWRDEAVGLLSAIALFFFSPTVLRWFDPTAGSYDAGVLQVILFAVVAVLSFSFLSWLGMKINFPTLWDYKNSEKFKQDFNNLNSWQRIAVLLLVYFCYVLAFSLAARVL